MRVIIFITHATLSYQHAKMTFMSLANSKDPIEFDEIVLYNTHQNELSNEELLELYNSFNIKFIKNVKLFDYDDSTHKSLGADLQAIRTYCNDTYAQNDHILLLKSDCLLSINFLNELKKFTPSSTNFVFVAPLINAKQSVTDKELTEYIKLPYAVLSSEDTFFMEDEVRSPDNGFRNRPGVVPGDDCIKYIACTVKRDWSCHYLPVNVFMKVKLANQSWGGSSFEFLNHMWIGAYKSFVVHKYHSIVSSNRETERPGEWGQWLQG
jgi:hypothetical protein